MFTNKDCTFFCEVLKEEKLILFYPILETVERFFSLAVPFASSRSVVAAAAATIFHMNLRSYYHCMFYSKMLF